MNSFLIKTCLPCRFHQVLEEDGRPSSHCCKENCWARFSKCLRLKALEHYLEEQSAGSGPRFSALGHVYEKE